MAFRRSRDCARRHQIAKSSCSPPPGTTTTSSPPSAEEPPERIVDFLRGVANGEAALSGAVARRLLEQVREGGGRATGVPEAIASALSAREVEVLLLLDDHYGTEEIAKRLFISEHTVRSHVKSLLHKLGVSSRREALDVLNRARHGDRGHSSWVTRITAAGS